MPLIVSDIESHMCVLKCIFWQDRHPCAGKEPETYYVVYCMGMDSRCGTYKSEKLNKKTRVLSFTISNTELPSNCSYTAIIETISTFGHTNSTEFVVGIASIEGGYTILSVLMCNYSSP